MAVETGEGGGSGSAGLAAAVRDPWFVHAMAEARDRLEVAALGSPDPGVAEGLRRRAEAIARVLRLAKAG